MCSKAAIYFTILLQSHLTLSVRVEVNDKYLNPDDEDDDIRKKPSSGCNYHRSDPAGRTFFDLLFVNNEYNLNYGGGGSGCGGGYNPTNQYHKPPFSGHNKPGHHKPHHHKPGGAQHKPPGFGQFGGNAPFQNQPSTNQNRPNFINNIATSISGIFPKPQEFGQSFGDGFSSFVQTIPQIAQSFQSILPNFQSPQFGFQSAGLGQNVPMVPPAVINKPGYPSDEIKPVHEYEDYDPITDPYRLRSKGARIPNERRNIGRITPQDQKSNVRFS